MFKHTVITSGDEEAVKEALEKLHDGNVKVTKVGSTVKVEIDSRGWSHEDEGTMETLYREGKIGIFQRFTERNS